MLRAIFVIAGLCVSIAHLQSTPLKIDYTGGPTRINPPGGLPPFDVPHKHESKVDYNVGAVPWRVSLVPDPPEYVRTPDAATAAIITAGLPEAGWTFASSANELSNDSLIVHWYEAVHEEHCLNDANNPECVGANFGLFYVQGGAGDPANIHWLQVVKSNHKPGAAHGTAEHRIDETAAGRVYYDNGGSAAATFLLDAPRREHNNAHEWTAWTFLVTGPAINFDNTVTPGNLTFWGGVKWGWTNACVPAPAPAPFAAAADACPCDCEVVPEPATLVPGALGLAALAAYAALRSIRARMREDDEPLPARNSAD